MAIEKCPEEQRNAAKEQISFIQDQQAGEANYAYLSIDGLNISPFSHDRSFLRVAWL